MKLGDLNIDFKVKGAEDASKKFRDISKGLDRIIKNSFFLGKVLPKAFNELNENIKKLQPEKQVKKTEKQIKTFDKLEKALNGISKKFIFASLGAWGFAKATDRMLTSTTGLITDIQRIGSLTGTSTGAIQRMMAAFEVKGLDKRAGMAAYHQIATLLGGIKLGGTKGTDVFQMMGVNYLNSAEEVTRDLMAAFKSTKFSPETKMFSAQSLGLPLEFLQMAMEGMPDLRNVKFLNNEQIMQSKKMAEAYRLMKVELESYIRVLGAELSPTILKSIDNVREWIKTNDTRLIATLNNIANGLVPVAEGFAGFAVGLAEILAMGNGFGAAAVGILLIANATIQLAKALGLVQLAAGGWSVIKWLAGLFGVSVAAVAGAVGVGGVAGAKTGWELGKRTTNRGVFAKTEKGDIFTPEMYENAVKEVERQGVKNPKDIHNMIERKYGKFRRDSNGNLMQFADPDFTYSTKVPDLDSISRNGQTPVIVNQTTNINVDGNVDSEVWDKIQQTNAENSQAYDYITSIPMRGTE